MRTESFWQERGGTYLETTFPEGRDILINGYDKYLNFGQISGLSGYGFRDNDGVMEFKNEGGVWATFGGSETDPVFTAWEASTPYLVTGDNVSLLTNDAGYAKLDTSNGPFTGNVTVSKSNPKLIATDTGQSSSVWMEKLTTLDGSQLVSQGRLFLSGNGLSLNGSGYANRAAVTLGTVFTIESWYQTSSTASQMIASGTNGQDIHLWFSAATTVTVRTTPTHFASWTVTYADGLWHHWMVTCNGTSITLYKDNVSQGTVVTGSAVSRSFTNIGNYGADAGHKCVGIIDQLVIWDKLLDSTERAARYNGGMGATVSSYTNVIAEYRLDSNYNDSSPNARNCTAQGSGNAFATGKVSGATQPLTDIPLLLMNNNGTNLSYGTFTHGWYETTRGTSNIYEGLSHQFNVLGSSKATITSSGFNIAEYTGAFITTNNGSNLSLAISGTTTTRKITFLAASDGGYISGKGSSSDALFLGVGDGASKIVTIATGSTTSSVPFLAPAGSAAAPSISFSGGTGNGMYLVGTNIVGIATAGSTRLQIGAAGTLAIGATTPLDAIMVRVYKASTQLTTAQTGVYVDGVHTLNADNTIQWRGIYSGPAVNQAGFNATASTSSGGSIPAFYALPQATGSSGTITNVTGYFASPRNTGAGTVAQMMGFSKGASLNSGGGTITNNYGYYCADETVGTNNYAYYSVVTAGSGKWSFYSAGDANNYFAGNVGLGITPSETLELKDGGNIKFQTTTGTKIGTATGQKIGFWNVTPVIQQVTNAYTSDGEGSAYTGIDNLQAGTPYAQVTDLNALRVAYETLRASYDDLLTKLKNTGVVA